MVFHIQYFCKTFINRFVPPEPNDQVKAMIREMAPIGLTYHESKIRNSIAAIISSIAHWDWPEQWPALFDKLMQFLQMEEVLEPFLSCQILFPTHYACQSCYDNG